MSERYKANKENTLYFITLTVIKWINLFTKPGNKHILIDSFKYCQENKGLKIHAYVIMSNHLHAIVSSQNGHTLPETIRDFKKFTSKQFIKNLLEEPESRKDWIIRMFNKSAKSINSGANYKVWKDGYHPIELDTNKMIEERLEYIHRNPVKEEIVIHPHEYKYSSAIDYAGGIGAIYIDKI